MELKLGGLPLLTDLTVHICAPPDSIPVQFSPQWHRLAKDLCLHSEEQSAWLDLQFTNRDELTADDLVVTRIEVGQAQPHPQAGQSWESRPGGIWLQREKPGSAQSHSIVTEVQVLFGSDAIEPRPLWGLIQQPLQLHARQDIPGAKLTVRHGMPEQTAPRPLSLVAPENGRLKVVQISDTHMVTGPGVCTDAIDADGRLLPESEADPLTVDFIRSILDAEKPDLVIITGDQMHPGILDTKSAIFKVVAPMIERGIPFAPVFGNHDSEGEHALSNIAQMAVYQSLPYSLCDPGPESVDGVGNYTIEILPSSSATDAPISTLYFLDSHGEVIGDSKSPDYDWIKPSQIEWFKRTSQFRKAYNDKMTPGIRPHLSLAFMHIPVPEFGDKDLILRGGKRGEPTESPTFNSGFYDVLRDEGVAVLSCGHDHVNDFCGLLRHGENVEGPWLCHDGGAGFGGYGSYDGKRYHRRARVWEIDAHSAGVKTWKRIEYQKERADEVFLVKDGAVVLPVAERERNIKWL